MFPIRPSVNFSRSLCPVIGAAGEEGFESLGASPFQAHVDKAVESTVDDIIDLDDDIVVENVKPLPQPKVPTQAQIDAHNLTHMPYRSWCPHCVAARRPNSHHRSSSSDSQRADPLLVADYCFVRDNNDSETITILVARLYPSRTMLATVVDAKGPDPNAVARLAKFIKDSGYAKVIYRSDQERSIVALFEETFKASNREGTPLFNATLTQMVPEASAVGESQSNGKAENTVQKFEDLLRTYKSALETHLDFKIPIDHPVFRWMTEHVASITNRHVCNPDGQTPYEAIHGQRFKGKLVEFGERCFYYVPKRMRSKLNLRWRVGTFVGNAQSTNEAYVAVSNGDVLKSRSIVRVIQPSRWDKDAIMNIRGVPHQFRMSEEVQDDAYIEELNDPHANADGQVTPQHGPKPVDKPPLSQEEVDKVDIRITQPDLDRFGYSDDCPRCRDLENTGKSNRRHNDSCRLRLYMAYKEADHPKWRAVRHLFDPDPAEKFSKADVDIENAARTPKVDLSTNLFENQSRPFNVNDEPNSVVNSWP